MKEAAGEANMTVITIVLIGIVLAIGTVIITGIMNGTGKRACESAGGTWVEADQSGSNNSNINFIGGSNGECQY